MRCKLSEHMPDHIISTSDAHAQPYELIRSNDIDYGSQTIVPSVTSFLFYFEFSKCEVDVIVDNQHLLAPYIVIIHEFKYRPPTSVHICHRFYQEHVAAFDSALTDPAIPFGVFH